MIVLFWRKAISPYSSDFTRPLGLPIGRYDLSKPKINQFGITYYDLEPFKE